jgi:hypothetical protein
VDQRKNSYLELRMGNGRRKPGVNPEGIWALGSVFDPHPFACLLNDFLVRFAGTEAIGSRVIE